jgi:hypothetical protein
MAGLSVVGVAGVGSSAGISMWPVMMAPAPAAMPARMPDDGQSEMRVDVGVAVPGKVLEGRGDAGGLQAADVGGGETADHLRVLAVRARVDDRVPRVVVHVDDGREVDVDADGARLLAGDAPGFLREALVTRGAERHQPRKRGRARKAEPEPRLEVARVQQRHLRDRLQPVDRRCRVERLAERDGAIRRVEQDRRRRLSRTEHVESADMLLVHRLRQRVELGGVGADVAGVERRDDHLPDLLLERHLLQRRLDPSLRFPVHLARRRGRLGTSGTETKRHQQRNGFPYGHRRILTHRRGSPEGAYRHHHIRSPAGLAGCRPVLQT